jgi:tetratricopeptide (TPR) repeat protein
LATAAGCRLIRYRISGQPGDLDVAVDAGRSAVELGADGARARFLVGSALFARYQRAGDAADLDGAVGYLEEAVVDLPDGDSRTPGYLSDLSFAYCIRHEHRGQVDDLYRAVEYGWQALRLCPPDYPNREAGLGNFGLAVWRRFTRFGDPDDLALAIEAFEHALPGIHPGNPDRIVCLSNLGTTLRTQADISGSREDLDRAVSVLADAVTNAPAASPYRLLCVGNLGLALHSRWALTKDVADIDRAVRCCREAVVLAAAPHPDQGMYLSNLAVMLCSRAGHTDDAAGLDEAIDTFRRAVEAIAPARAGRHRCRLGLGLALRLRFGLSGEESDLDEAVDLLVEASEAVPADDPGLAYVLSVLGDTYLVRHGHTGAGSDLDAAVAARRRALATLPAGDPSRLTRLDELLTALLHRARRTGQREDLHEAARAARELSTDAPDLADRLDAAVGALDARETEPSSRGDLDDRVAAQRAALATLEPGSPRRPRGLAGLALALSLRFTRTGVRADLDEAAELVRQSVAEAAGDAAELAACRYCLAAILSLRSEHAGTPEDAVEAVEAARLAVAGTAPDDPDRAPRLHSLSNALNVLALRNDALADHAEAAEVMRQALDELPAGDEYRPALLQELATSLWARARRSGRIADLDEAVEAATRAVRASSADDPQAVLLTTLGNSLRLRFHWTGDISDMDAALDATRAAVAATPSDDPELPKVLSNLVVALCSRFERLRDPADLDEAVDAARRAVNTTPADNANLGVRLTNLAVALNTRLGMHRSRSDSDEVLDLNRRAVATVAAGHPNYAMYLANLGAALSVQAAVTGTKQYLDEAVDVLQRAVEATPEDHPSYAFRLYNYGIARSAAARAPWKRGEHEKLIWRALRWPTSPVMERIRMARRMGETLVGGRLWREAAELLTFALGLAGQLAPRDLGRLAQQSRLEALEGLAADAVACWLKTGKTRRAVEVWEQGHAVLASQLLDTRTDLTDLSVAYPHLAERFARLRDALDTVHVSEADENTLAELGGPSPPEAALTAMRAEAGRRRQAAAEFDALLGEIRTLPGFERFLLRPDVDALLAAAADGPIVLINVSTHRSDAMILAAGTVHLVRLRALTPESVREHVAEFRAAVRAAETGDDPAVPPERGAEARIRSVMHWMWESITRPVLRRLGIIAPPRQGRRPPQVWWCPSGPLSLLPLHAAGYHDLAGRSSPATVLDRVVSSYTPSVRALIHARSGRARQHNDLTAWPPARAPRAGPQPEIARHLLVVAMPQTPDADDLPAVRREVEVLRRVFPGAVTVLDQPPPTRQAVLDALPRHDWVHFACHAYSDPDDPSASRLLLHDHLRRPLTVVDVARLRLETPGLAFLSACSSGQPGERLADEAIHLASAFQLAGYRHVIAALWHIDDDTAADVTAGVYQTLAGAGFADAGDAARALHDVVLRLRDTYPDKPSTWSTYIHVGR